MSDLVVNDYLAPIQGEDQAGSDAKYDSAYEALESEVKKFGSLFDEVVDWSRVEKHSIEILTQCSKDIKVACYLCRAWTEKQEFTGMQEGLELVSGLLQTYGSQLFPRRQRAREGAFEWLESQLKNITPKLPVNSGCKSQISSCRELISAIQGQFESLHSDTNVNLLSIRSLLDDALRQLEVDDIDEAEGSEQSEHCQAQQQERQTEQKSMPDNSEETLQCTKISAKHESKTPSNNNDVELSGENIEYFKQPLKKAAQAFLNADIGLSIAYQINRHLSWFEILELPQHVESGQTDLHLAVSDESQQQYRDLAETGGSIELIRKLESILLDIPFWLTGHFYLGKALINHGYTDVAESVKQELQLFTKRLCGIEKLKFKNGTPFACSDTQKWIINEFNETKHIAGSI